MDGREMIPASLTPLRCRIFTFIQDNPFCTLPDIVASAQADGLLRAQKSPAESVKVTIHYMNKILPAFGYRIRAAVGRGGGQYFLTQLKE